MRRTTLEYLPDGLVRKFADYERRIANLERKGLWRYDFDIESIRVDLEAFGASVYRSSAQSIPNVTDTDISFSAASFDDGGWFDAGTPTQITAPEAGRYLVQGFLNYQPNATGSRAIKIFTDGGSGFTSVNVMAMSSGSQTQLTTVGIFDLDVGDALRLVAFQDSGGALSTATNGAVLSVTRFGAVPTT